MTPPAAYPPPFGDDTDDALSALLDHELAAFAADHGTTEAAVRAALDAWPETGARLAALERVRGAVAAPVPPLDDVARRRLVTGALSAPPEKTTGDAPRPRGTWLGLAAAAVVALLIVAAIGTMVLSDDDGDDQAGSGGATRTSDAPTAVRGALGDLGDVSDPATLRALLEGDGDDLARERATADVAPEAPPDALSSASSLLGVRDPDACADQFAGSRAVRFVGTGTYEGQPVVVVGLDRGDRTIAVVVPAGDCASVLTSVSR
jgi:hypothetical protein